MPSPAEHKLAAKIASQSTAMLLTIIRTLNLDTTAEATVVTIAVTNELHNRLGEAEFIDLMNELEAEMMAN